MGCNVCLTNHFQNMFQVLLGCGSIAQVLTGQPSDLYSDFQSVCFGWGFALMIGILVSGGVSGGHLNPAVTLAMAALRKCSWIQVCQISFLVCDRKVFKIVIMFTRLG